MARLAFVAAGLIVVPFSVSAQEAVAPFADTSRLITIGGAITEIVHELGEGDRLIARDRTSTYPPAARDLPDIGYMRALSPEGVLSLAPTAILASQGSGPVETMEVLEAADVPLVLVPEGFDSEAIVKKIRIVGAALGVDDKAEALARKVSADLAEAQLEARGRADGMRVLFVLGVRDGRILASGTGTSADGIIRMAGGVNALALFSGFRELSDEAIIGLEPDAVLLMKQSIGGHGRKQEILSHPAISLTPAGKSGKVIEMDGSYLLGFGPRTAAAVRDLAKALHEPAAVTD
ncbi:ABC transporter substrate-binding protein [Nitratireductor sp. GISD-1A_MAKvit]|uniref:heme/hemin ABC transporter substrate-binding protein n=1 Tax=Nitratireductor sp. GISD-1A_MAKvit TaxID=3234198 RepID=UPI00346723FE